MTENKSFLEPNIGVIADKGSRIYQKIKAEYDPKHHGKYLAIESDSGEVFLGNTSALAYKLAHDRYPDKVFYLQRIGFDTVQSMARYYKLI